VKTEPTTKYLQELNAALQKLSKSDLYAVLYRTYLIVARHKFALPFPVAFVLRATVCMFALLLIMPLHPMAIPAAFGGGISVALCFTH
jgi:putative NADPH-quinone reductase